MKMSKHTPTPWKAVMARTLIHIQGSSPVCSISVSGYKGMDAIERNEFRARVIADADYIVRCVNAHDDLVKALEDLIHAAKNSTCDSLAIDRAQAALTHPSHGSTLEGEER
jgi:hypothetical protein